MTHSTSFLSSLEPAQRERLDLFARLLLERNRELNLTGIDDPDQVRVRHFEDSLAALPVLDRFADRAGAERDIRATPFSVIDVGSGAGFPGLALAIARPAWRIASLDSTGKKITFQEEVIRSLGLENAELFSLRAEEAAHDPIHREAYDIAAVRALAPLTVLLELALPFVCVGGNVVAWKGRRAENETKGIDAVLSALGGGETKSLPYALPECDGDPNSDSDLRLIVVPKIVPTPTKYPRKAHAIRKRPLSNDSRSTS